MIDKIDKFLNEQPKGQGDGQRIKQALMALERCKTTINKMYGKTYNKYVGRTIEETLMHLDKAIEEWKNLLK